jgi:NAD(P)-dependent dehydrogenase (short-subunit alcohol dehydrogenase family)
LVAQYPDDLLVLPLDVTDRVAVFETVKRAHDHFGELDVVVNNAGYGHFGMVEELSEQDLRDQIETNVLGAVWVTQAALPYLRARGGGHFLQVSSVAGLTAFPGLGAYHASKWALEGISQALAHEVAGFGIHVTLIEPASFSTDWAGPSARHSEQNEVYSHIHESNARRRESNPSGDPVATAAAVLRIVDAEVPPLRVLFGKTSFMLVTRDYGNRIAGWSEWQPVAELAHGS